MNQPPPYSPDTRRRSGAARSSRPQARQEPATRTSLLKERPAPVEDAIGATRQAYDGSTLTFRLLRACGWGAFLNLGFFHAADWLLRPFRLDVAQGRLARRSIDLLRLDGVDNCVDVGCGRGRSSFQIAMENPSVTVEAIDFLPENVSAADYLYGNTRNLNYRQGSAEALPFESESCDRIHCLEAAFHFDRPEFLRSAHRILRPDGRMVLVDFMFKSAASHEILPTPAGQIVRDIWKFKDFWTCDQYRDEATSLGFEAVEEHDWSAHVTTALQYRFSLICWAGTKAPLRRILCKLNPLLSGFSADDWQTLSTQAVALAQIRRELRYVGLVLRKRG